MAKITSFIIKVVKTVTIILKELTPLTLFTKNLINKIKKVWE